MRKLITGVLAAALTLGLLAVEPADAKVYKMKPEERAAALKEKRVRKAHAKKSKKAAEEAPGGWVEVKGGSKAGPSDKKAKKSKRDKAEDRSAVVEKETKKSKKSKRDAAEKPQKVGKGEKLAKAEKPAKAEKTTKMSRAEKRKSKNRNVSTREAFRDSERGGSVRASSTEVRRPGGSTGTRPSGTQGNDLDAYSVSRPGYDKGQPSGVPAATPASPAPTVPEVRHEVQPGPLDSSKPLGSQPPQGGEGRF